MKGNEEMKEVLDLQELQTKYADLRDRIAQLGRFL